jgi:hypothetical protein
MGSQQECSIGGLFKCKGVVMGRGENLLYSINQRGADKGRGNAELGLFQPQAGKKKRLECACLRGEQLALQLRHLQLQHPDVIVAAGQRAGACASNKVPMA